MLPVDPSKKPWERLTMPATASDDVTAPDASIAEEEKFVYSDLWSVCCACVLPTPNSQLFICIKETCGFALHQTRPILSPSLFYRYEKVFCGPCAFRGLHAEHKHYMRPAEPFAFKIASGEVGTKLEMEFEKYADLTEESPVEFYMIKGLGVRTLPKLQIVAYLEAAENSMDEWHRRVDYVESTLQKLKAQRQEGDELVYEQAEKFLTAFSDISNEIRNDNVGGTQEREDISNYRREEHNFRMRSEKTHQAPDEYSPRSSISSRGSSIRNASNRSIHSTGTPISARQHAYQELDSEIMGGEGGGGRSDDSDGHSDDNINEFVVESVFQTNQVMGRRLDMIRHFATSMDDATAQIADLLDARIESVEHKKEVVAYLEQKYSIKWPRQLD